MSKIQTFLENILSARYGKDVRQSIHDAIQEIDSVADTAQNSATAQAEAARKSAQTAALNAQEAEKFKNEAAAIVPEGYSELVDQVQENTVKVDTIIEKADLGIKADASGEEIHLTDSAEGKAVEFALYGKAKQNTTQGNQLFDANSLIKNSNDTLNVSDDGYTVTVSGGAKNQYANSYYSFDVNLIRGKTIYLNVDEITKTNSDAVVNPQIVIIKADNTKSYHRYDGSVVTVNVPEDAIECRVNIYGNNNPTLLTEANTSVYKGLRVSFNKDAEWEKFTGGQPSPNPQYPQPIEVSGASGSVEVKSCGANRLDVSKFKNTSVSGANIIINDDNSITISGTATSYVTSAQIIDLPKGTYFLSGVKNSPTSVLRARLYTNETTYKDVFSEKPFTIDDTIVKTMIYIQINPNTTVDETFYPMLNEGTTALPFEPYKETLATIPKSLAGIKVSSNGNYTDSNGQQWICDEIVKYADGSGERIQEVKQFVFDGSDDEEITLIGKNTYEYYVFALTANGVLDYSVVNKAYSTHFVHKSIYNYDGFAFYNVKNGLRILTKFTTLEELKTFMRSNPITFVCPCEPIYTPLTAEEIAEIENLHTFNPITNISNDADCGMSVTYYCDSKNYIDNKIALLTTAMVNSI